jgi:predicted nucleic acid-binding protein
VSRSLFRGATLLATGPLVAWFDRSDQDHEACAGFFQRYHGVFVSTWPVLTEVCHLTESLSLA